MTQFLFFFFFFRRLHERVFWNNTDWFCWLHIFLILQVLITEHLEQLQVVLLEGTYVTGQLSILLFHEVHFALQQVHMFLDHFDLTPTFLLLFQ